MSNKMYSTASTTPSDSNVCKSNKRSKSSKNNHHKQRINVMASSKHELFKYIKSEILDEESSESEVENGRFSHTKYCSFVTVVTDSDENLEWFVFDDGYTTAPIVKGIYSILGKSSPVTYLVIPDKVEPVFIIERNLLKEHFSEIMTLPMLATDDEDFSNFLVTYLLRENYDVGDLSQKSDITPVDVFAFVYKARVDDDILYFDDADVYTSRNLPLMSSDPETDPRVYIVRPFGDQQPFLNIILPIMVMRDKRLTAKLTSHHIPLRKRYNFSDLGIYKPTLEEVQGRIDSNRNYVSSHSVYREYNGTGLIPSFFGPREVFCKGRVMVDGGALFFVDPDHLEGLFQCVNIFGGDSSPTNNITNLSVSSEYSDAQYMSMSKFEPCYDLSKKQWFIGERKFLNEIVFRKDAFDKLQMDVDKKNIIKKICSKKEHVPQNVDFIDGKGGGNIFLLHGTPGTGKTLTAEAISELLEKPLYKVNISEYEGMSALEKGIERALRYAERWDATLLIDEADVALEKRNSNNIERNAIVAVFLRLIEYYTGTMFLTSNRAEQFDEAFKSRITFAIHYEKPCANVRFHIWNNILMNLSTDIDTDTVEKLSEYNINGRQIKNIITTASYMSDDGKVLTENVDIVLEQTLEFENFIRDNTK